MVRVFSFPLAHTSNLSRTLFQVSLSPLPHRATTCDIVVSLRRTRGAVQPALIQTNAKGPAHTGRCRLRPHGSSGSETKCCVRFFQSWALSPSCFGSLRSRAPHSTLMLHCRCYSLHESLPGKFELSPRPVDSEMSQKSKSQLARGSMHKIALLRRGRCERSHVHRVPVHERRESNYKEHSVTVYI